MKLYSIKIQMFFWYLCAVKIGKTVLGKKGLQHSVTTNIVLVSCNTSHFNVVPQLAGRVGLAEREGLVWDVRYRESELHYLHLTAQCRVKFHSAFRFTRSSFELKSTHHFTVFYVGFP